MTARILTKRTRALSNRAGLAHIRSLATGKKLSAASAIHANLAVAGCAIHAQLPGKSGASLTAYALLKPRA